MDTADWTGLTSTRLGCWATVPIGRPRLYGSHRAATLAKSKSYHVLYPPSLRSHLLEHADAGVPDLSQVAVRLALRLPCGCRLQLRLLVCSL